MKQRNLCSTKVCLLLLPWAILSAGCSTRRPFPTAPALPPLGTYHTVRPGETLSSIARAYGLSWQTLAQLNRLADPDYIEVGQSIMIPFTQGKASSETPPRAMAARVSPDRALGWPTEGVLGRGFGLHDGRLHRGIDISAPKGTPIVAAADGLVIYSGPGLDGYGNIVILDHEGGLTTMYAHNDRNTVRVGERVRRGQLVAWVGETGRAWGTHVHFEVHRQGWLVDPRPWLP